MNNQAYGSIEAGAKRSVAGVDADIANHYLSGLKYGLEGTDGSLYSNYKAYMANHHPFLSIFYSSPKNPNTRLNKALTFWNSLSLMFFYSCLFPKAMSSFPTALLITLLMMPYMILLDALATCRYARERACCVTWLHRCGSFLLILLAGFACAFIVAGILMLKLEDRPVQKTVITFGLTTLFSQILPLVLGLTNWYLTSWSGILCCPQCSFVAFGHYFSNEEYRCCPLLEILPINFVLNMYCLGEPTFGEDKERFHKLYPGRVAVDVFEENVQKYESGLLLEGSASCGTNLNSFGFEDHIETI